MELDYWSSTTFEGADYDREQGRWDARLRLADGSLRTIHPAHIVMATSQIGTPIVPTIPTLERFSGQVMHSSRFKRGSEWADRSSAGRGVGKECVSTCRSRGWQEH